MSRRSSRGPTSTRSATPVSTGSKVRPDVPGGLGADHAARSPDRSKRSPGGCGATAFVWAQHHGAVRRVAAGDGPGARGLAPAAVRRIGRSPGSVSPTCVGPVRPRCARPPTATEWRLDGEAPWITGWGLADVFVIMARADDDRVVTVLVDRPYERPELSPGRRSASPRWARPAPCRFGSIVWWSRQPR